MWDSLIKLFHELSETSQLAVVLALIVVLILYTVWEILTWLKRRDLKGQLRRTRTRLEEVTADRNQLQQRLFALDRVDSHVWTKPDLYDNNCFVSREQRQTRFISLVNLKGGVGKTTLLGICTVRPTLQAHCVICSKTRTASRCPPAEPKPLQLGGDLSQW
jgi:hypothetical protein